VLRAQCRAGMPQAWSRAPAMLNSALSWIGRAPDAGEKSAILPRLAIDAVR
jgi:hypothetical protein